MAITYGMSVNMFWEDNPDLFWAYRFSYYKNKKEEEEIFNVRAWFQGAYFYDALTAALCNAFGKRKVEYAKAPYPIHATEKTLKEKQEDLVAQLKNRVNQVQAIIKGNNQDKSV